GVLMQLARCAGAKGRYTEAGQLLRQVLDQDKTVDFAYGELYTLYMVQNQPEEAEKILKLAFQNNPKKYQYLSMLALHYSRLKRVPEMSGVLQQIKAGAKDFADAYFVVGDFYLRLGDGESAKREYTL